MIDKISIFKNIKIIRKCSDVCKGGLTAHQGLLDFKQWSLPHKIPEGIKQGSPPSLRVLALLRG